MTSREKLQGALQHRSGPIPVDLGSTPTSGIHCSAVAELRDYFGLEKRPVKVIEPYQMLGEVDDELIAALGIDTARVYPPKSIFGFGFRGWKLWRTPWGQEVQVPLDFNVTQRGEDIYIHPEGDLTAEPSGHMPASAYFFDSIIRQKPIDEDHMNPADNLEEFGPISDEDLTYFAGEVQAAVKTKRAVVANFGGTAFGDIGLVPAPFLKDPRGIRDVAEWYMCTSVRQDYVHAIFAGQLEIAMANLKKIHATVGNQVDVVFLCAADFGTQASTFCSAATYMSLWHPYYKVMNDWIHAHTTWKTFKHSCGAILPLLPCLIESGFDIINPVQCSAVGMDPQVLKDRFGPHLTFWGGAVNTQHTLPFGTPEEVRAEVSERCRIFGQNGGFVFNSIHNIQASTPVANIVSFFETLRDYNARGGL